MRQSLINYDIKFVIGDTRNSESCNNAIKGVDFVFHAAALKQVPLQSFTHTKL